MSTELFNEDSLRAAIVDRWGEHGAHADVFDHILKMAREHAAEVSLDLYDCEACSLVDEGECLFHRGISAICAVIDKDEEGAKVLARLVPEA